MIRPVEGAFTDSLLVTSQMRAWLIVSGIRTLELPVGGLKLALGDEFGDFTGRGGAQRRRVLDDDTHRKRQDDGEAESHAGEGELEFRFHLSGGQFGNAVHPGLQRES